MRNTKGFEKFIKPEIKGAKKKEAIRAEKRKIKKEITEKRWRREEDRRQEASSKFQGSRFKEQDSRFEKRNFKSKIQNPELRTPNSNPEIRTPKFETRNPKFREQDSRFENRDFKSKTRNTEYRTQNSELKPRTPKFETRNPKFREQSSRFENRDFKSKTRNTEHRTQNFKHQTPDFEIQGTRFKEQDSRFEKRNFKHKTPNSELRTQNTEHRTQNLKPDTGNHEMPLNKFIAYCGVCGRREAAELVKQGLVTVNGDIIFEPGFKVRGNEDVKLKGKRIFLQHNLVYFLLNKPKDYLTTVKDPEGRKTVYDLIRNATDERVYSVGRLDRNTTGVLLLTNDGELTQKLTHPSFQIKKIYEVTLDKPLTKHDFEQVLNGITLEDGFIKADAVGFVDAKDKRVIGIEIHSGRNRIVRRIFEYLGYDVKNLDRVMFANLTKKNVDRGKWRMLTEKEVRLLKHMNQSFIRKD